MALATFADHVTYVLRQIGRPGDARLTDLCASIFVWDFYEELNNIHEGGRSLNCSRLDQVVLLTAVHNGTFQVSSEYRDTKRIRITDPANPDALYDLPQQDYFALERTYPANTPRAVPQFWDWRRQAGAAHMVALTDTIEIFPKPDRNLTLTHTYWRWLTWLGGTSRDLIMLHWGKLMRSYLCWQCFEDMGEHADAQVKMAEYLRQKELFREWDDELYTDEAMEFRDATRSGIQNLPVMG